MISPEVPTGLTIGQSVFGDNTNGEFDDGVGVMGVWCGEVRGVDVEVDFTFRTAVYGISEFDTDGPTFGRIAEMMEFSFSGPMFTAVVPTVGTGTFCVYFRAFFDDGLRQIVDVVDPFTGIGQIVTGTGHGRILLEMCGQGGSLPNSELFVKSISQLLCYSLQFFCGYPLLESLRS